MLFANFTTIKTNILLTCILAKNKTPFFYLVILILDITFTNYGRFFLIYIILNFVSQKLKIGTLKNYILAFFLIYLLNLVLTLLLFQNIVFSPLGIVITTLFALLCYKN